MTIFSQLYSPLNGLTALPVDYTLAAPTSASLVLKNAANATVLTATSIRGEDIGNATTITVVNTTNAASVAISGYDITVSAVVDTTTGADIKTLLDANSNIAAIASFVGTTNATSLESKQSLSGGDDKLVDVDGGKVCSLMRDSAGVFTLTLNDQYDTISHVATMGTVSGTAGSSGVAKVECTRTDEDTFKIRLFDYAGAATDVTAASQLKLGILVSK